MKKFFYLLTAVLLLLTSCGNKKGVGTSSSSPVKNSAKETQFQDILEAVSYEGCITKDGFYYTELIPKDETYSSLIMYLDKKSLLEIPLCNKPNCKHKNDSCNAFISGGGDMGNKLFTSGKKLYLITPGKYETGTKQIEGDYEAEFEKTDSLGNMLPSEPAKIFSMNLDGTNRTEVMEFESNVRIEHPLALAGNKLYCQQVKMKSAQMEGGDGKSTHTSAEESSEFVCIDLRKKTITALYNLKDKSIIGFQKNKVVLGGWHSEVDIDSIDSSNDNELYKYFDNMDWSVLTFDLSAKKEKTHVTGKATQLRGITFGEGLVCYFDSEAKKVKKLDLETDEITDVPVRMYNSEASLFKIIDGKLIYEFYEEKDVNAEVEKIFYHDFATGENKELTLYIKSGYRITVPIIEKVDDSYLVIPKYDEEKEHTWAGTIQYNRTKQYYALIKQSDYWQSKAAYNYFEGE